MNKHEKQKFADLLTSYFLLGICKHKWKTLKIDGKKVTVCDRCGVVKVGKP